LINVICHPTPMGSVRAVHGSPEDPRSGEISVQGP
jgi:hypothetical protein